MATLGLVCWHIKMFDNQQWSVWRSPTKMIDWLEIWGCDSQAKKSCPEYWNIQFSDILVAMLSHSRTVCEGEYLGLSRIVNYSQHDPKWSKMRILQGMWKFLDLCGFLEAYAMGKLQIVWISGLRTGDARKQDLWCLDATYHTIRWHLDSGFWPYLASL